MLVERLFGYMERERCRIDDFLIITFTKAAAAELRDVDTVEALAAVQEDRQI